MQEEKTTDVKWYVMRSLFRTELKTQAKLMAAGIEVFVPTVERVVVLRGRKRRVITPVVSNLMFVHSDVETLQPFVESDARFQYIFVKGGKQNERMVVADEDMQRFIQVVENAEKPLYFNPAELNLENGARVRIIGGGMDGVNGTFMRVKGSRSRRLIVVLPDTLAVAVEVQPDLIEVIQ